MRSFFFLNIRNEGRRGRRSALRFHLLVSFLPENSLPVKELFIGDAIGFAPCGFWHTTCKTFIDDSCPLFTAYFVCNLIHNIYYLIGEKLCHGTHVLPYTLSQSIAQRFCSVRYYCLFIYFITFSYNQAFFIKNLSILVLYISRNKLVYISHLIYKLSQKVSVNDLHSVSP